MEPHEERMLDELNQLNERIDKLSKFINSKDWTCLSYEERELLVQQRNSMVAYAGALVLRISLYAEDK